MTPYLRRLPQATLHLMAFGWSGAVLMTLAAWMTLPLPFWLLALAYLLPALLRPRGAGLSIVAALLVAAATSLLMPLGYVFFAILILLAESARALTLSRHPSLTFLRIEQKRGLALLLLVALLRAIVGRPDVWLILLLAVLYLIGAFVGLPMVQLQASGETNVGSARPGLRLALLIGLVSAVLAGLIGVLRFAVEQGVFAFLQPLFGWIFTPIAYVLGYVVQFFLGLLPRRPPPVLKELKHPVKATAPHFKQHAYSAAYLHHLDIFVIIASVLVLALIVYLLYRRQQLREMAESPDVNAPRSEADLSREAVTRRRRAADYGEGARRLVRRTVGVHVHGKKLPPGTTVRSYARSQGWEEEWLATYEHARYGFLEPFPESKARAFIASFVRRFGGRGRRGKDSRN